MRRQHGNFRWDVGVWRGTAVLLLLVLLFCLVPGRRAVLAEDWVGDRYSLVVTDETAVEIVNWILAENPQFPFRDPMITIHPDGIYGSGFVQFWDVRVPVSGKATVFVADGRPNGRIEALSVGGAQAPAFVLKAIGDVRALAEATELTIVVTKLELREGEVLIEGDYR